MRDRIFVRGLEFEANHGFYAEERLSTRRFRVDLELSADLVKASGSDSLSDTIDYFRLCEIVMEVGTGSTFKLLETLAERICQTILDVAPEGTDVTICLEKLAPPCPGVPQSCGVQLHRSR